MHWSSLIRKGKEVLNVAGQIVPAKVIISHPKFSYFLHVDLQTSHLAVYHLQKHPDSSAQSLSRVLISTMVVKDNVMAAGGFQGELICKV